MTIASEVQRIKTNIANAYTSCNSKGATMPASQVSDNLATCIDSISGGTTPTGTLSITANGTYDVTNYASADVSVSGGGSSTTYSYPELKGGNYYVLTDEAVTPIHFEGCDVGNYRTMGTLVETMEGLTVIEYFQDYWRGAPAVASDVAITNGSLNLGEKYVKHISLNGFPSSNYMVEFNNDTFYFAKSSLTSVCISSMKNLKLKNAFGTYSNLAEVDVSSIDFLPEKAFFGSIATGGAFGYTSVQELYFNSLNSNSFGAYTNQFNNMLRSVRDCTVHFPSNLQSVIGSWSSVTSGFGGTNTTVLFDLPATT